MVSPVREYPDEGGFNIKSRSPGSLQSRNTKNLSIQIDDSSTPKLTMLKTYPKGPSAPSPKENQSSISAQKSPLLAKRLSEAQIYTLSGALRSSSSCPGPPTLSNGATNMSKASPKRVKSLSLSVKTDLLEPAFSASRTSNSRNRSKTIANPQVGNRYSDDYNLGCSRGNGYCDIKPSEFLSVDKPTTKSWVLQNSSPGLIIEDEDEDAYVSSGVYRKDAYQNGPLCVLPPNIYLCSEPTVDQVLQFDVIINVAKEIKDLKPYLPVFKQRGYHHIKWTHTSKICRDLFELTDIIHNAEKSNRKVLVHCQCGVSRSASLIVAYIMRYQNQPLNDAYNLLKKTAKDISPNMSLIFQLMEWNDLLKEQHESSTKLAPLKIPNTTTEQHQQGLTKMSSSSPIGYSSVSTNNTPCTPKDYLNSSCSSASSTTSSGSNRLNSTNGKSLIASQYSPILESLSQSPPELLGDENGHVWSS